MPTDERPRLSAGRIDVILACPRRLAATLRGEGARMATSDAPFRLSNAVNDALRAAWMDPANRPLQVDPTPPPSLSREEAHRFRTAVEAYTETVGDRDLHPDPRSGEILTAPVVDGTAVVSGRPDLLLRGGDGNLQIHRVLPGPPPARPPTAPATADVALGALVRRGPDATTTVTVVRLWSEPPALLVEHVVPPGAVDALRRRITDTVEAALAAPGTPDAVPGWCCRDCPVLRHCAAVPSPPVELVLGGPAPRRP